MPLSDLRSRYSSFTPPTCVMHLVCQLCLFIGESNVVVIHGFEVCPLSHRYDFFFLHTHTHTQSYYRLGVALQGLERYEEAMIAFAEGMASDPKQAPMLHGLIETMLRSPLRGESYFPMN